MTDRELLELAAKATGKSGLYCDDTISPKGFYCYPDETFWNPLTNDGDALRLAVKLDIDIVKSNDLKFPKSKTKWCTVTASNQDGFMVIEREHPDPYSATRRAIVRAAAALAKYEVKK